ncbi:hypothetical protein FRC17_004582 [Serendipita sp. 399]|nr:hypothetical protein FRC17_004582 [Serendipita sp. 399]
MIADGGRRISCMFTAQALEPVPSLNSKLLSFRHDYHPIYQAHICEGLFLYQCQEFPTTTTVVIDLQTAHEIWRRDQDMGEKMSSILLSNQLVAVCTSKGRINNIELHRLTSSNVVARLALPAMTAPWSIQCANWNLTTSSSNPRYNISDDPNEEIICLFMDISRGRSAHPDIHQFVIAIKKAALIQIAEASPDNDRAISWEVWGVDARVIPVGNSTLSADFAACRSRILLQGSAVQMSRIVGYSVSSDLEINYYALVDFSNRGHQSSSKKKKPRILHTLPSTTFTEFFEDDVTNGLPFSFRLAPVKKDCCTGRIKGMNDQLVIVLKHDELLIWEMGEP